MLDQSDLRSFSSSSLLLFSLYPFPLFSPSLASRFSLALLSLFRDLRDYLKQAMKVTNTSYQTPDGALLSSCDFLSANMCARSLFGKSLLHK